MNLVARLEQAENYLKNCSDRNAGWVPYFESSLAGEIPYFRHTMWDLCDVGWRFVEAWHLIRRVTGDPISEEETQVRAAVFGSLIAFAHIENQ